jgi:hypothetical protein
MHYNLENVGIWRAINATNKYCHWVKSIATKCLKHFVKAIQNIFENIFEGQYLWQPFKVNLET